MSDTPPPSSPPRRPGFAPGARLALFAVRHLIGLGVFAWLTKIARETDPRSNLWMAVAVLFVLYLGAVVVGGRQLFAAMRRARRRPPR